MKKPEQNRSPINPEPRKDRRFAVSRETFSQERFRAVRIGLQEMQTEYPEVVGLTIFGSMVKGCVTETSDVDGLIYVDVEHALDHLDEDLIKWRIIPDHTDNGARCRIIRLGQKARNYYSDEFNKRVLAEESDLHRKKLAHLKPIPISDDIITSEVKWAAGIISANLDWESWSVAISHNLAGLFHLQIGDGLKEYRQKTLTEIEKYEQRDLIWQNLIRTTRRFERYEDRDGDNDDTKSYYPQTFDKAREMYR